MVASKKPGSVLLHIWLIVGASAAPSVYEDGAFDNEDSTILQSDILKLPGEDELTVNYDLQYGKKLFQGDLKLDETQMEILLRNNSGDDTGNLKSRTGVLDDEYRWPKNSQDLVVIPYIIDTLSGYCKLVLQWLQIYLVTLLPWSLHWSWNNASSNERSREIYMHPFCEADCSTRLHSHIQWGWLLFKVRKAWRRARTITATIWMRG